MAKYMITGSYTVDGIKGVLKEGGTGRRKAVESAINAMGGHLDSFYYMFGGNDVFGIAEIPDNVTALALAMGIGSTGTINVSTTVLLTPEEVDQATKKVVAFRGAGQ
jgi:uncharacterized protein with GYD domain